VRKPNQASFLIRFIVGLISLFNNVDGNEHCSWCHYLSCVPTSKWSCNREPASCTVKTLSSFISFLGFSSLVSNLLPLYLITKHLFLFFLQTTQLGNQLSMTCLRNGKSASYILANPSDSRINSLCVQLCR